MTETVEAVVRDAGRQTLLDQVAAVWTAEGIPFTFEDEGAVIEAGQERSALQLACGELKGSGARVCYERTRRGWSIYVFPQGSRGFSLDLRPRQKGLLWRLGSLLSRRPRLADFVAIAGPDGVGKSTTIQLVRSRLAEQAPFLELAYFQWRPGLLPPLSRLAGKPEQTGPSAFRPRRNAGRMQAIRIAYYFADYVLGSWWKLRKLAKPRLILFDRCALDMEVDPVRFGLSSAGIVRRLYQWVPKPSCVVLLHAESEQIAQRKDDLTEPEIRTQLEAWLQMAGQDRVHNIVEVDNTPEEVAERVFQVLVDAFVAAHEQDCPASGESRIARAREILESEQQHGRPSSCAALPSRDRARVLIPLDAPSAAAAAGMKIYNAQRPVARLGKAVLTGALQSGLAQRVLDSSVQLYTGELDKRLASVLGGKVSLSIALGSGAERRRVVIQATRPDGTVAAYVKAGTGEVAIDALRHEESVLQSLRGATFASALVPEVLGAFDFGEARVLIQSAPPNECSVSTGSLSSLHAGFLADLHHHSRTLPLELSIPHRMAEDLGSAGYPYYAHQVDWATRELSSAGIAVPGGLAHADFAPWNLLRTGNRLFVFDWEFARDGIPPAYDLFHFAIASAVELHGHQPGRIFDDIAQKPPVVGNYLQTIGLERELSRPLLIWYLCDALETSVSRLGSRADSKEAAMRRAWSGLLMLTRYGRSAR